ncbi:hypothetical protein [Isoptericola rhizosphaerae]|uniref:hypothetical protein n=1 Tax=Isoptericola rhizosphaerae TaxID=3377837 RepID=UPI00383A8F68
MAENPPVRPTVRCLENDLGQSLPPLEVALHDVDHPLVERAQDVPAQVEARSAERIISLTDRVWFKRRAGRWRGAVGEVTDTDDVLSGWWLAAAGRREDGSLGDFYADLAATATRNGRGTGEPDSGWLLPEAADTRRLQLETTTRAVLAIRRDIRRLIARSVRSGHGWALELDQHRLLVEVRCRDEAYLALGTDGFVDPRMIAVVLDSVPGIPSDAWQAEPAAVLGIQPGAGQIVYSTLLPADVQKALLEEFPDEGAW